MSKELYKKITENSTLALGTFEKIDIDKNESEILSKEANNPACQMLFTSNKKEHEDSQSTGWNIVKKRKKRETNLKIKKEMKSSKTLAKFAKIPCRNYPCCKWKNKCWYLHKEECLPTKLNGCKLKNQHFKMHKLKQLM